MWLRELAMPLKEEGAYLVVCRGENLHTSGLVLVSPLAVEVQEDVASGRVRTTVKDLSTDKYVDAVHVKAIGSRNDDFVSGETDLRGVFVADGIHGTSTVIAQADAGRYAFFRGRQQLVPRAPRQRIRKGAAEAPAAAAKQVPMLEMDLDLLQNVQKFNTMQQKAGVQQLQETYQSGDQGVEAQKAFQ